MKNSSLLSLQQVQPELMAMQSPGCYWVTCQRQEDARHFIRQVISAQQSATLISADEAPRALLTPAPAAGPDRIPLFSLPKNKKSLLKLDSDLARTLNNKSGLVLFYTDSLLWDKLSAEELTLWMKRIRRVITKKAFTFLIITFGSTIINLRDNLQRYFRQIDGVAHLEFQQDSWQYRINWWYSTDRLLADRALRLKQHNECFIAVNEKEQPEPLSRDDVTHYLADKIVLEGAPPLSKQWVLFADNEQVFSRAQQASAATVIFSLTHTEEINSLAKRVHSLRRSRGNGLKIVIREMKTSLRYSDERLLLACGVNAIVPSTAPMSRFLTTLEGLQGLQFSRHVPGNLDALISALQPLQQKGYLRLDAFCLAVSQLMSNTLLPENDKGLLVALRPVPELKTEQVLTLCKPRRYGDLVTTLDDRVYLFLSSCRFNDLDTALTFIFSLPHDQLFANRVLWFEDHQILAEVGKIKNVVPDSLREMPLSAESTTVEKTTTGATRMPLRRIPQPVSLNLEGKRR